MDLNVILLLLEAVEEGRANATGMEARTTVWEAHLGVQPQLDQCLLGPFGCLGGVRVTALQEYFSIPHLCIYFARIAHQPFGH